MILMKLTQSPLAIGGISRSLPQGALRYFKQRKKMGAFVLGSVADLLLAMGTMRADIVVKLMRWSRQRQHRGGRATFGLGYHRWDGNAYVWTPGEWRQPPHEHAKWVERRWDHRHGGYVFVEGHWE